ncbi:MAG: alpha/beta hydrolase [Zoogloeaceae bacterium]|nr:alpha/beta hydrolase [Zoogloeaceae bacterium]
MDIIENGNGPIRIVAVHGIQGTRASWLAVADRMADVGRFVLPNLRGRALAARGARPDDYRLGCLADDLEAVVHRHVGEAPFYLAGWSMGVSVSLEYLSRAGVPRPRGVMLMSGTPMLDQAHWFTQQGEALLAEIAEREVKLGLVKPADREAVAWTWQAISRSNQLALLPSVREPVLIVHGEDDDDSPWSHAVRLAAELPDATLRGLPGVGHSILKDATDEVVHHMRDFITRVERTT